MGGSLRERNGRERRDRERLARPGTGLQEGHAGGELATHLEGGGPGRRPSSSTISSCANRGSQRRARRPRSASAPRGHGPLRRAVPGPVQQDGREARPPRTRTCSLPFLLVEVVVRSHAPVRCARAPSPPPPPWPRRPRCAEERERLAHPPQVQLHQRPQMRLRRLFATGSIGPRGRMVATEMSHGRPGCGPRSRPRRVAPATLALTASSRTQAIRRWAGPTSSTSRCARCRPGCPGRCRRR